MGAVTCRHCGGSTKCGCASCHVLVGSQYQYGMCKACGGDGLVTVAPNAVTCRHCGGSTKCGCASCHVLVGSQYQYGICNACRGVGSVTPG